MSEILRSKTTFFVGQRCIREGELLDPKDPLVKGREHLLEPVSARVEQATAAPGEKRSLTRPTSKRSAKKRSAEPEPKKSDEGGDDGPGAG